MKSVYSVTQVNSYIKNMFTQDYLLQMLSVRGEVSNCKYHSSGHIYFTLKDEKGQIACVMFAGSRGGLQFDMQEGMQVVVSGTVDVYPRDGRYQLYAKTIERDGAGALFEKFEALKRELEESGMFAQEYKQPIPRYIRTLGVVTAPTGAAVRDIITVTKRRNPYVQIILYPAIVQGDAAPESIIRGIHMLERYGVDAMIVGRGGGSIEDLWAFNDRRVAQAIFDCGVPIISAVGHETDTTIADFVADLRAATPSAAAELAVFEFARLSDTLREYKLSLNRGMMRKCASYRLKAEKYQALLKADSPISRIRAKRMLLLQHEEHLQAAMKSLLSDRRSKVQIYAGLLKGLSPLDKLTQGFSFVTDASGKAVTDITDINIGDPLTIHVKNGILKATVTEKERAKR
ncbi:MAG: exodeoxyribonuclease VII large subunit [Lachnospiraceae bacterium]|nr:exodeoxyribonuclease VII large subunit [Lachnospiraceae bacterium]